MEGVEDAVHSNFHIYGLTEDDFSITLQSDHFDQVIGTGIIDDQKIGWEFRQKGALEGFEVYEIQDDGSYHFHAEYSSPDQFRTMIDGQIKKL